MSRKDTIIIAVLINAGLLIVLFASALKSSSPAQELTLVSQPASFESTMKKQIVANGGDEVDQALLSANSNVPAFANVPQPPVTFTPPQVVEQPLASPSPMMSFADDLKTFTEPQTLITAPVIQAIAADFTEVKVKKGDVLEKIARHNHSTVDEIISYNKLSSTNLRIGQVLKIPHKKGTAAVSSTVSSTTAPASAVKYYTVKNGDNPWTIAVKNHMKVEDLLKLNNLDQEKARKLKPGDKLKIQ